MKRVVDHTKIPFEKIYKRELHYQKKMKFLKTSEGQKRKAEELARMIFTGKKKSADDAATLARYFDINFD